MPSERRHYAWALLGLKLRRMPGRWVREFPDHPARLVSRINQKQHPALRKIPGGYLEAMITNEYAAAGEPARGDVWVRYTPWPPPPPTEGEISD